MSPVRSKWRRLSAQTKKNLRREKMRAYYDLKARGICVGCAKADAVRGHVSCQACLDKQKSCQKKHYRTKRETNPDSCYICLKVQRDPGYKSCSKCRAFRQIYMVGARMEKKRDAA